MSDLSDIIDKTEGEEEILSLQSEEFLAEQDKKFEELRVKLQTLKEENKRQMDIIINNLDQLMAEKSFIDETIRDLNTVNEHIENNMPVENHFKVVDYLAKVTGYNELDDVSSIESPPENENKQRETEVSTEHKEGKVEVTGDAKTSDEKISDKINGSDVKSEVPEEESESTKSEVQNDSSTEKNQTLPDSEKSSKKTED